MYENILHAPSALTKNLKLVPPSTMNFAIEQPGGKILEIHTVGSGILRKRAKIVTAFDGALGEFIGDMLATMYAANGIGLAAPQVGKSLRIAVVDVSPSLSEGEVCNLDGEGERGVAAIMPLCLINPEIKQRSSEIHIQREGCLSIPKFFGHVKRPAEIVLEFVDRKNASHALACGGILARCIQHEIDHLHGKLYTDYLSASGRKRLAKYLAKNSQTQLSECDDGDVGAADNLQG
jgi:peptide deformylase